MPTPTPYSEVVRTSDPKNYKRDRNSQAYSFRNLRRSDSKNHSSEKLLSTRIPQNEDEPRYQLLVVPNGRSPSISGNGIVFHNEVCNDPEYTKQDQQSVDNWSLSGYNLLFTTFIKTLETLILQYYFLQPLNNMISDFINTLSMLTN